MTIQAPGMPPPPQRPFGLGWLQDRHDPEDRPVSRLFGGLVRSDLILPASLMRFRIGDLQQGGASSCVAHALARAIDISFRFASLKVNSVTTPPDPPRASRRFIYFNARRQDVVEAVARGESPLPMVDAGCYPRLAMRAVQKLGFCTEADMPYSDDPRLIAETPRPAAYRTAFDQSGFTYYRVVSTGLQRAAEVSRALVMGYPVIFGTFADTAFMRWDGREPISAIDTHDPSGGGHMLCAIESQPDRIVFDNWWGPGWGAGGFGHMTPALFGSGVVSDVYVIETAPTFTYDDGTVGP